MSNDHQPFSDRSVRVAGGQQRQHLLLSGAERLDQAGHGYRVTPRGQEDRHPVPVETRRQTAQELAGIRIYAGQLLQPPATSNVEIYTLASSRATRDALKRLGESLDGNQ